MSVLSRLTVTPLLYACGFLLLACISLGVALKIETGKVDVAQAATNTARADLSAANTERDAWKTRVDEIATANLAYGNALTGMHNALDECQSENLRLTAAGQKAIDAAHAEALDADRTLKAFTSKYQIESRKPPCQRALEAMASACPALEGY